MSKYPQDVDTISVCDWFIVSGFGMSNMDWKCTLFMISTLESYYPDVDREGFPVDSSSIELLTGSGFSRSTVVYYLVDREGFPVDSSVLSS